MAITTANFKNGIAFLVDGKLYTLIEFQHVKPGKGAAFVRTKLRDVKANRVQEMTFRAGEKFDDVRLETREMQYLYNDGTDFHFMNTSSYEQIALPADFVADKVVWLKENDMVEVQFAGEEIIGVEPPMFVELEVVETEPGFKGDTVQGGSKPATLETGAVVSVPMFVEIGDRLKVDTRDGGRYITRV